MPSPGHYGGLVAGLVILDPVAPSVVEERPLAPRRDGLDGLAGGRVALLDNQKANAGLLLSRLGDALTARHAGLDVVVESKIATSAAPDVVMDHLRRCDAVVLAIAD